MYISEVGGYIYINEVMERVSELSMMIRWQCGLAP